MRPPVSDSELFLECTGRPIEWENYPLKKGLPPLPATIQMLPVAANGYPVPAFVSWVEDTEGYRGVKPEFRVASAHFKYIAVKQFRCWTCGQKIPFCQKHSANPQKGEVYCSDPFAFVIGPMCSVNRISAEPPSHPECAEFAVKACPFLLNPNMHRRENNMPEDGVPAPGFMIRRNPGVMLIWYTKTYSIRNLPGPQGGTLFHVGEAEQVKWVKEGRAATRAECLESIESGLPILAEMAEKGKSPKRDLETLAAMTSIAKTLLPAE